MYEIHVTLEDWTGLIVTSPETLTMLTIDGVISNDEQDTLVATITWNLTPADLQLHIYHGSDIVISGSLLIQISLLRPGISVIIAN